jgi:hypothetical protein
MRITAKEPLERARMRWIVFCLIFGVGMLYMLFNAVGYANNALGFG